MTSARRAPELSAILSIDSCCTTVPPPPPLLRALDDFDHAPALGLRQRAGFDDAYRVARLRVGLVVGRELLLQLLVLHLPQGLGLLARHPSAPPASRTST